jgi:hypothetical protein
VDYNLKALDAFNSGRSLGAAHHPALPAGPAIRVILAGQVALIAVFCIVSARTQIAFTSARAGQQSSAPKRSRSRRTVVRQEQIAKPSFL